MSGRFRLPMLASAVALLGLIALLATLQYRWLGQISAAERDRMAATLRTRASGFAEDFDRELNRAYLLFQAGPTADGDNTVVQMAARYDRWQATSRFPRMIKDIYLYSSGAAALRRFDPATRFVEPSEWPPALDGIRASVADAARPAPPQGSGVRLHAGVPAMWPDVPAMVIPAPMMFMLTTPDRSPAVTPDRVRPSYVVLLLDGRYIRDEMLPALARQYFEEKNDGFEYELAIVRTPDAEPGPIYRSVAGFAPRADARVDASNDLFQLRVHDFGPLAAEVSRFAFFSAVTPGSGARAQVQTVFRQSMPVPDSSSGADAAPLSIVVQQSGTASAQAIDDAIKAAAGARIAMASAPHWRLLVQHPAGSLELAVDAARRRNLAISTGILGVLGLSVGFLVVSTRRAQDLARQQLEFVATVSHELRTPLAVIRSAADNLADGVVDDESKVRQYGQLVRREGLRLTDLVEQVLEFAGLQSGHRAVTPRPVAVDGVLRDAAAAVAPAAETAGLEIHLSIADALPAVAGDASALRRVFQNLLSNAAKYGGGPGSIDVRATVRGGAVEISVADRGIGIAPADQERIFDPFYRAPGVVAAQIQGAGLGLSLVKRIVEAHGGRVSLTSAPGAGSTFTVALPVMKGAPVEAAGGVGETAPQHS